MNTTCSIPGSLMLSVQLALPVTRARSSLRGTPPPTNFSGAWVTSFPPLGSRVLGHLVPVLLDELDGLHDVLVARAAAQVPFQALPYLLLCRVRILLEQADGGHDHARCSVAALQNVRLVEGLLHRMPHTVLRDAPDGGDLVPVSLHRQDRARLDRLPVDVDRAGPATGRVASRMYAPDPQVLSEMVKQEQPRLYLSHVGLSVYSHLDPTQPSLLSPKIHSAPVRLARNPRSIDFPQAAVNVFYMSSVFPLHPAVSLPLPLSVRKCRQSSTAAFFVHFEGPRLPATAMAGNCNVVVTD